jgi:hypothetical protein
MKRHVPQSRISFRSPVRRLVADDAHGACRIDGFGHVGATMDDLAIVTMAVELGDRFAGNFDFDRAAAAGDSHRFGHGLVSNAGSARARVTDRACLFEQRGAPSRSCAAPQWNAASP